MKDLFIIALLFLLTLATGLLWAIRYMERSERGQTYHDITTAVIRCEASEANCTNKEAEARKTCDAAKKYRDEAKGIHDCLKELADKPPTIDLSKYIDHARPYYLKDGPPSQTVDLTPPSPPEATDFAKSVAKCENIAELKKMFYLSDSQTQGIASIIDKWPGNETDEQFDRALRAEGGTEITMTEEYENWCYAQDGTADLTPPTLDPQARTGEMQRPESVENGGGF